MRPSLPEEAVEFGRAAESALGGPAVGGFEAARRAEVDPSLRAGTVGRVLEELGAGEIDPLSDPDTAAAAGELCRAAGRVALPYPLASRLAGNATGGGGVAVVGGGVVGGTGPWRVDHADLLGAWTVTTLDGRGARVAPAGGRLGTRLGPFVGDLDGGPLSGPDPALAAAARVQLTLSAWWVLGAVERALELAVDHVATRVQFGQPLSAFQAVQFQLADAAVGVDGLRELCRFTLWRLFAEGEPERALPDVLALRLHAADVARAVLRTTQQLHGAAGLCDEYDISILVRHVQPVLRLPFGAERTAVELYAAASAHGFEGLFPHGRRTGGSPPRNPQPHDGQAVRA